MACAGDRHTDVQFEEDGFGVFTDKTTGKTSPVRRFTWKNANNVTVQVITYGATITSIRLPGKNGVVDDIVMGFDNMEGYLNRLNPYFGATVGRVANRVGYASITINNDTYNVSANLGKHQLHGGFRGFDKINWNYYVNGTKVVLSYLSVDGEEGYPGDVLTNVSFELNNDNEFLIDFKATCSKPTFINLTNHSYFNLAGHDKGADELYKHVITINADNTTDVDKDSIPTGKLLRVDDSIFDLRIPKVLGDVIHKIPSYDGYDHNFCVNKASAQENTFAAKAYHPASGRTMEIYTNQHGVQFYTSNGIPEDPKKAKGDVVPETLIGKNGCHYYKHGALCFETQNWPDAINHDNFPRAVLYPGELYHHTAVYKFFVN
ncbi:galactose mutarotase-like [Diorhabda carinulata]|uniref:galactose mutarotase-like n=1 Tax=Diorhabda carinulata TaxID=1163345 RepID=UPI0025A1A883|nr:galactose mutarotase-like [Diorhabda carinulata]XP_057667626.1 galactose mutarotase-like [Diorhabda carinulata]XP_057667627.1 galactose mutarotase-like [Diorhabda carinulata]